MTSQGRHILSPALDSWLVGGGSLLVLSLLAAIGFFVSPDLVLQNFLVLTVLFNGTHFLASYRLLYSSRDFALSYPWASVYMPAILIAYSAWAIAMHIYNPAVTWPVPVLTGAAAVYLALHYTGQAWGMMASFAYLDGVRFKPSDKRVLRFCLRIMAAWHMLWAMRLLWKPEPAVEGYVEAASIGMNVLGLLSFVVGLVCLSSVGRSEGHRVTGRVVLPYIALHVWYAFLYVFPAAIFWVQIAHALQYLPFPLRVELNRSSTLSSSKSAARVALSYGLVLAICSALLFGLVPHIAERMGVGAQSVWVVIASVINIHHYFIDGCIWHISNPVVSKELFAHTAQSRVTQ